jgi:hypothetical protein
MDRKWWYRAGLAALVVVFVLLVARMTIIGMRPDTSRIERAVAQPGEPPAPSKSPAPR